MIAIVNVTEKRGKGVYKIGTQLYEVRINRKVITTFEHEYEQPLHVCLQKAATAVAKADPRVKSFNMLDPNENKAGMDLIIRVLLANGGHPGPSQHIPKGHPKGHPEKNDIKKGPTKKRKSLI